jgi:hypothetical protein
VLDPPGDAYRRIAHMPTAPGARTSFFVPELDRLLGGSGGAGTDARDVGIPASALSEAH